MGTGPISLQVQREKRGQKMVYMKVPLFAFHATCIRYVIQSMFVNHDAALRASTHLYMNACWASDHWVASSNPLRGKFRH